MTKLLFGKLFLWSAAFGVFSSYLPAKKNRNQGIEGMVYRISGNHMPSPGVKKPAPKGIRTTIYIYERTTILQADRQGETPFYSSIHTRLVRKTESDSAGYFKVRLPPGSYSLFTKKDTLFYACWFDKDNTIAPVDVHPHKMTHVELKVDYDAYY